MYVIVAVSCFFLLILAWLLNKKMILGIWSIAVFRSNDVLSGRPHESNLRKPALRASDVSDVPAEFIADPFIIFHDSMFYMFFEILDKSSGKGIIGVATSKDGEKWTYGQAVLKKSYHLSYPYVFKYESNFYMIPESSAASQVILYKATHFPYEWSAVGELLKGKYVDSSIFRWRDKWWMFAGKSGNLHLFYSDELDKNWVEHPKSPLISGNMSITRPGGRVIVTGDHIYRYTQDGQPNYGSAVRVFKILSLTESEYEEKELDVILSGSKKKTDWNRDGMHSIDQLKIGENQWLIAVDGHRLEKRSHLLWKADRILAGIFQENS